MSISQTQEKDLKAVAKAVARELEILGYPKVQHTHMLTALSRAHGFSTWNAIAAQTGVPCGSPVAPTQESAYPAHYVCATYPVFGLTVDLVLWEDPQLMLGYGYYAYDRDTGKVLTATEDSVFSEDEVPTYDDVDTLVYSLKDSHQCDSCSRVFEEEDLREVEDYSMRIAPGGHVPSGECPECGALCFPFFSEFKGWPADLCR